MEGPLRGQEEKVLKTLGKCLLVIICLGSKVAAGDDGLDLLLQNPPGADSSEPTGHQQQDSQGTTQPAGTEAAHQEATAEPKPSPSSRTEAKTVIEEIVVTANRRVQNIQDVPSSIQVLGGEELERLGADGFEDYVFAIPGADLADSGVEKKISIRGIGNLGSFQYGGSGSASPVGLYLNDTPIQGTGVLPDLDLYDLARIEVLKGPQGTLYGEGAQGGAIKMLLNRADPYETLLKGDFGLGRTSNGEGFDHFQKFVVNAPVVQGRWGIRLVGSRRWASGFVDYFNVPEEHANDATNLMGRGHLDGEIGDRLGVSAMLLHQRQRLDQFPHVQFEEGTLRNRNTEDQVASTDLTLTSLTLDYDFGFAQLTSATSWLRNDRFSRVRLPFVSITPQIIIGPIVPTPPIDNEWFENDSEQSSIAQEVRLVSNGGVWLDWIGGIFYRNRDNDFTAVIDNDAGEEPPPPIGPGLSEVLGNERFEQFALFGEMTVKLPWALELMLGLRGFRETVEYEVESFLRGPFYPLGVAACGCPEAKGEGVFGITTMDVTPKVSLAWFVDDLRMLYATVAKGTRSAGTNVAAPFDVEPIYTPDSLWSYEIGLKSQWLQGVLTANLAAVHNDWRNPQIPTSDTASFGGVPVELVSVLNAGRAFSRGIEAEVVALPFSGTTLGFSSFFGEGEIVEGDEAGVIPDHTKLPQLAELSYAAYADYTEETWSLFGLTPFIHFDTQYTGDRTMRPPNLDFRFPLEGFQTYNLNLGVTNGHWEGSLGLENITDARQQLGLNVLEEDTYTIGRPRAWVAKVGFAF